MSVSDLISSLPTDKRTITAYDDTGFRIQEQRYEGSIIVFGDHIVPWNIHSSKEINVSAFDLILKAQSKPEFILVGSGKNIDHPSKELKKFLKDHGIGLEYMNTVSALKTWPILLADGRYVAGCFLPAGAD